MLGLMQDSPLLISSLIEHAARYHPAVEIVSETCEGPTVRTNYKTLRDRAAKLARALLRLGVKPGDRIATLAWNTHRHMELYFAVSGIGAVLHTVNPRLFPQQIEYIIHHAEARLVFFDIPLADLVSNLKTRLGTVEAFIAMTDEDYLPENIPGCLTHEALIANESAEFVWPRFDERTASSLCYTSGTTGHPKGVLYSHRSTVLHSFAACASDGLKLSSADSVMLAVPLFHVNAWGVPYASAMCGAKLVLPGPSLDGKSLYQLAVRERCNFSLGVPTVWLGFFKYIDDTPGLDLSELKLERVVIGGSAAPRAIIERFRRRHNVFVIQAWGMTETSPLATIGNLLPGQKNLSVDQQIDIQARQGRAIYGVELRIVDDEDHELPHHLLARGPWVTAGYYGAEGAGALDADGWFSTGDVAKIHPDGFIQLTDRSKDVIKSGGEWISSIDLENAALAHPGVQEAAVIGIPHPKWQERPLLIVVRKPGASLSGEDVRAFLAQRVAKWQLPDDVVFADELPHTATGKIQKTALRERFRDGVFGTRETSHA